MEKKEEIVKLFNDIKLKWGQIDFNVHAIAFSDKQNYQENINTTREKFFKKYAYFMLFVYRGS